MSQERETTMIALTEMSEEEFQTYWSQSISDYALHHQQSGRWSEKEALSQATREYQGLLPQGRISPGNALLMIVDQRREQKVGILWYSIRGRAEKKELYILDIEIFEQFRRSGYATQTLQHLEGLACSLEVASIGLHVFGSNIPARRLYEQLGYAPTNIRMVKTVSRNHM